MGTQATKTREATLDKRTKRLYTLAQSVLIKRGITSRAQIESMFDVGGVRGLDGVGPVLTKLIEKALQLSDSAWAVVMPRISIGEQSAPTGGPVVSNVPYTWYPSDALTEGHSLSVPDEA